MEVRKWEGSRRMTLNFPDIYLRIYRSIDLSNILISNVAHQDQDMKELRIAISTK